MIRYANRFKDTTQVKGSRSVVFLTLSVAALSLFASSNALATLYCGRPYSELVENPAAPFNAVGYLNNGCTAFLIGKDHIAAAAHCFVNTTTGAWQTDLRFYPNFHPNRVTRSPSAVPHGTISRVVVGSRAGESVLGSGMDWAIARIGVWKNTAGLNMTPLTLAPSATFPTVIPGKAVINPAYTRHHFPYNDNDSITWDNMEWDTQYCGGMWALKMRTAPFVTGTQRDRVNCNSRWAPGMLHGNCVIARLADNLIIHNCDTIGGSSGSPVLTKNLSGKWVVIGVGHGGGPTPFNTPVPVCVNDTPARRDNVAVSTDRFRDAPRFAANVAVHRRPDNPAATAVFAVDSDLKRVVYRAREGTAPTYTDRFSFWKPIGSGFTKPVSKIAACSANAAHRPLVFVIVGGKKIYSSQIASNGSWTAWMPEPLPSTARSVADIDTTTGANGRCMLLMTTNSGNAFSRQQNTDIAWGPWLTIPGAFTTITGINIGGVVSAAMTNRLGDVWRTSLGATAWSTPVKLAKAPGVRGWRDIDLTWDEYGRGFMLAVPTTGGNRLWFVPLYGTTPWAGWRYFETHLWAPNQLPQNAPNLRTITASRWMEDPAGTTSPVIFSTDDQGNVYLIEYSRVGSQGWKLDWKSFYHETIPYLGPVTP